jgi:4-hydroxy-3-methylbut-2-enyl diphosphate reductase
MIVIGDHQSSNTRHLAELCQESCDRVIWIEGADELSMQEIADVAFVGITAGASTPGWIIKEVKDKMSEEIKIEESGTAEVTPEVEAAPAVEVAPEAPEVVEAPVEEAAPEAPAAEETGDELKLEESFEEMLEKSIKTLNTGEKVIGEVVNVTATEIEVDLGTKHAGYIKQEEFSDDPSIKLEDVVKVGDKIEATVQRVNDQDGIVTLSKKRLDAEKKWEVIEEARDNKTIIEGVVKEENKGGVVVNLNGIRIFVPASQTGLRRNEPMTQLVGTNVRLHITEVNKGRRRVVGSIRSVLNEERAAKSKEIWENIEVDKHYQGVVKSLTSYGAFVDIGGVDGMVHISELSWSRIKHPSEVVSVGDEVDVYVIKYDPEKKKISLGMKDRSVSPWENFISQYATGDIATVKVVKLMSFGAFAEVVPGVDGLIHISQIADHRVEKPEDELEEGQMVDVKITDINMETRKVSLSRRAVLREMPVDDYEDDYDDEE